MIARILKALGATFKPMSTVPEGIYNPNNLYNDVYGDLAPLAYGPLFLDKIKWLQEQVPFEVVSYGSVLNEGTPGFPALRTATFVKIKPTNSTEFDLDVRTIERSPYGAYAAIYQEANGTAGAVPQIKPYPGYEVRNPSNGDPIGEIYPHPSRKLWRPSASDSKAIGEKFERVDGIYQKVLVITVPGAGPFGFGGKAEPFWEQIYRR